jgi:hypothetical protein
MEIASQLKPFEHCPPRDGYHCVTSSLAKIFDYYGCPLSEDMLLGLGAGMGFIYWQMKMDSGPYIFIGGRANNKDFFTDLGKRVGVTIRSISTASAQKAETALLAKLARQEPVMLFGDMGYLPWFDFPGEYHFGGHTFVVCGYDGERTLLASDMDQRASGLKKGFYFPITLEQLRRARNSTCKPFPPNNTWLEFDFSQFHAPQPAGLYSAIQQMVDGQLNPPIKNIGVKGMRHTAKELLKWPDLFSEHDLRMNLFNFYIFIEIGGTGGGCFRYMYSRFLKEAAQVTGNPALEDAAVKMAASGEMLSSIGQSFKNAETDPDLCDRIQSASAAFKKVAGLEEEVYLQLSGIIQSHHQV